jgi:uncharacterized short protein YbdD (DUF466 family)
MYDMKSNNKPEKKSKTAQDFFTEFTAKAEERKEKIKGEKLYLKSRQYREEKREERYKAIRKGLVALPTKVIRAVPSGVLFKPSRKIRSMARLKNSGFGVRR